MITSRWAALSAVVVGSCVVNAVKLENIVGPYGRRWAPRADEPAPPTPANATDPPPPFDWYSLQPSDKITWTDCEGVFKCARLNLPLDYQAPSDNRTVAIALQFLPAKDKANYKGTILVNPGGPGDSATSFMNALGETIAGIVGDSFDVLGFDPRGVGASTPRADCFDNDAQRQPWFFGSDDRLINLTDGSLPIVLAKEKLIAERCVEKIGGPDGIGRFSSTASVVRDMLEINKQLGQDKVQFWGFSYGSVLGQYFAAMHPDKIGRLAIDGVFDGYNYRAGLWSSNIEDTDKVLSAFGELCFQAGPEKCAFYSDSADDINARVLAVFDKLDDNPIVIPLADTPGLITSEAVRQLVSVGLYAPMTYFPLFAFAFKAIETDDIATLSAIWAALESSTDPGSQCATPPPWLARSEALNAIACADADELTYSEPEFAAFYRNLSAVSSFVAPVWAELHLRCTVWKVRSAWRYTGELAAANTSTPLLVVQPRWDPATPLSDAEKVLARYGGARLLVQNSYGHSSLAAPSACSAKHIRAYFEDGTLPPEGTVCDADVLPLVGAPAANAKRATPDQALPDVLKAVRGPFPRLGNLGRF